MQCIHTVAACGMHTVAACTAVVICGTPTVAACDIPTVAPCGTPTVAGALRCAALLPHSGGAAADGPSLARSARGRSASGGHVHGDLDCCEPRGHAQRPDPRAAPAVAPRGRLRPLQRRGARASRPSEAAWPKRRLGGAAAWAAPASSGGPLGAGSLSPLGAGSLSPLGAGLLCAPERRAPEPLR